MYEKLSKTTQQVAAVKLDVPQATMCKNGSLWKKSHNY